MDTLEKWTRKVGLGAVFATLAILLWGVWRGARRAVGSASGHTPKALRTRTFYFLASVGYFGFCYRLWQPLSPLQSRLARVVAYILGVIFFFPGLALVLWGRLTLAQLYNVSSSFGAQLFADHRLVSHGPFAYLRHPMYLGILFIGVGGIFLYRTWTFVFLLLHFPALALRARREEQALSEQFGAQWKAYCQAVPGWIPRLSP